MRKVLVSLAASLVLASPALANEARLEVRGGLIWDQGEDEAFGGVAAGYDLDVGPAAFVGAEVSADKILVEGSKVTFGFNGRAGAKLSEAGKLYATGGYQTCDDCEDAWTLGAGYQHNIASNLYVKAEYRHYFFDKGLSDPDTAVVGVGVRF